MRHVSIRSLSLTYGRHFALHRVSFELEAGTATALLGENGSGKTSLLTLISTVESPTSGTISYDEVDRDEFARRCRDRVGWVAHDSLLYDHLTGRENLVFYANMYGVAAPESRAEEWLARTGLADAADRRVGAYSRGMRQRISIARAVIHDPDLLLLDEPMTGLDQQGRDFVASCLEDFHASDKIVVFATHDLDLAGELADRAVVLSNGRLGATDSDVDADEVAALYREHA